MTSKLVPASPADVMVIRKVTENITTFSAPFSRFGRMRVGGRGTAVKLSSGSVAVFSPMALTDEVKETVKGLGRVRYIAALDMEHHIYLGAWHKEYPEAKILAPEGLAEKRAKQKNEEVRFDVVFTDKGRETQTVDEEFDKDFEYEYFPSHANKELVFNYKPERTMIEADLIFNLPAVEQYSKTRENPHEGFWTKFFTGIQNTRGPATWQKRFIWYVAAKDKPSFNGSVMNIDNWDFDRIIPCHGDVIESGGKGVFRKVMQWHLTSTSVEQVKRRKVDGPISQ